MEAFSYSIATIISQCNEIYKYTSKQVKRVLGSRLVNYGVSSCKTKIFINIYINFIILRFWKDGFQNCSFMKPIVVTKKLFKLTIWWKLFILNVMNMKREMSILTRKKFMVGVFELCATLYSVYCIVYS